MQVRVALLSVIKKLVEKDHETAARIMESMDESEAVEVLKAIPPAMTAKVISALQPNHIVSLLTHLPAEVFDKVIDILKPESISNIIFNISDELREKLLEKTSEKSKKQIREILTYPEDSAGALMSRDYLAFHYSLRVKDVIKKIKALSRKNTSYTYTFVVDDDYRLVGVLRMYDLLTGPKDANLGAIMKKEVFTVDSFSGREDVADEMKKHRFSSAPVVDKENHLLGIIRAERLISEAQEGVVEDFQKMFGAGAEERTFSSIWFSLRKRLPWLHINLATAFAAAGVVAIFEDIIHQITVLAVFLPVVAGQGGNAGAQTLAIVMRGLVMREIPKGKFKNLILKEASIGALNGVIIGIVTAIIAWLWRKEPFLGLVIGLGMIINLVAAGLAGAAIPIVMKKLGADPAQSSSIILTTVTDVVGFFAFLSFAIMFKNYLI